MLERRRADLEAKRQKLAEMRRAREERESLKKLESSRPSPAPSSRGDIDEILKGILPTRPSTPSSPRPSAPGGSPSGRLSDASSERRPTPALDRAPSGSLSTRLGLVSRGSDTGSDQAGEGIPVHPSEPDNEVGTPNPLESTPAVQAPPRPEPVASLPPPPRIRVEKYTKGIQTDDVDETPTGPSEDEIQKRIQTEVEAARAAREKELEEENERLTQEIEQEIRDLSEEERVSIFAAPEFAEFMERTSRIVQRALSDAYDYTRDYTLGIEGEAVDYEGKRVKQICAFSDERWTQNRSITDIDWSPKYPELVAASYNKNPAALNDPDGIVAVWNMHLIDRPEFVFHSQSDVLSVSFSPFHPNLVFGGTYSGQILLWDTRAKHLPVLKTPLSATGHTYPVYSMQMVGTQNAHNLMTSSTDGLVCSWLVDMLAQPQETLELTHAGHNKTNEVAITTFDFPDNETSTFWVGTEEGNVYQATRYDRAGSKAGLNQHDMYKGHSGPITGLHFHPLPNNAPVDFSDIFLTCSVDWTVKMWKARSVAKPSVQPTVIEPLYSFEEADDYVYDVKWHPVHPAVFGSVDGGGRFDIWNLNLDTEVPTISTPVGSGRAINKLAWDHKDGRRAALGSSDGQLYIYDIGDVALPRETEWADFQRTMTGIINGGSGTLVPETEA